MPVLDGTTVKCSGSVSMTKDPFQLELHLISFSADSPTSAHKEHRDNEPETWLHIREKEKER